MTTEFSVIRTKPMDTRILRFLVMGGKKKRATIVARNISEKRDKKKNTGCVESGRDRMNG
jgi:hypothetical protein